MQPKFFKTQEAFRNWLEQNHDKKTELIVGFYKVASGKPSMSWSESVDQALCFGWIDGVRKSIDDKSYQIRFSPRRSTSVWSAVNIRKMKELTDNGLMTSAGLAAYEKRISEKSAIYSHEKTEKELPQALANQFKSNKSAWDFFMSLAPSYRKASINWVMSAKQETTRQKRLVFVIKESAAGTNQFRDHKYKKK